MNPRESPPNMSISAVERDTGIGKDTLRIWERRYGFPQPSRDDFGERMYGLDQVEKLRVIRRLMDQGHRPGRIVSLPVEELQRLSQGQMGAPQKMPPGEAEAGTDLRDFLQQIVRHDVDGLRHSLNQALVTLGHQRFINLLVAPLNGLVGDAWMRGELEIFEEHLYTETMISVLRQAINNIPDTGAGSQPCVLLTTFPQESHGLGLLMAECILKLHGCRCLSLGVQTPLRDIVMAAQAHQADVVALSFSLSLNPNHVLDGLVELRAQLGPDVQIWAGGRCPVLQRRPPPGVLVLAQLDDIPQQVQTWRREHS
jgi:DNA-binding transcriptional MerR regulator/methylmalonyl-CoA mutase cobalamin-binding subunit